MEAELIELRIDSGIATVILNRPDKRNAINDGLREQLISALGRVQAKKEVRALVLTGRGKAFCAGGDIAAMKKRFEAPAGEVAFNGWKRQQRVHYAQALLHTLPIPTIAAVNGPAIAGGCGLATLCDFTLASSEAEFGYTEVRIGFVPAIVSAFLLRQVGEKQARDLLLTGRIIGAEEAFRLGLVNEVVAPDHLLQRARALANSLLENSPASLAATKRLLKYYAAPELDTRIADAVDENARIRTTTDFHEGITSFLEKRKPQWRGK